MKVTITSDVSFQQVATVRKGATVRKEVATRKGGDGKNQGLLRFERQKIEQKNRGGNRGARRSQDD